MTPFLQENVVFREVYCFLGGNEGNAGWCGGDGLLPAGVRMGGVLRSGIRHHVHPGQRGAFGGRRLRLV